MDNISISLSESDRQKAVSEVRVDGVIDTLTAGELEQVIETLLRRSRFNILVDLAGVEYISSAGWGIFISHIRDVRANEGDIKLANMIPDVYEVFELLEFDNVLESYESVDDALVAFGDVAADGKKKETAKTRIAVESNFAPDPSEYPSSESSLFIGPRGLAGNDIETRVLRAVKHDPFASVRSLRREISRSNKSQVVGWWQVFRVLMRHGLVFRKNRFRFAWGRA